MHAMAPRAGCAASQVVQATLRSPNCAGAGCGPPEVQAQTLQGRRCRAPSCACPGSAVMAQAPRTGCAAPTAVQATQAPRCAGASCVAFPAMQVQALYDRLSWPRLRSPSSLGPGSVYQLCGALGEVSQPTSKVEQRPTPACLLQPVEQRCTRMQHDT